MGIQFTKPSGSTSNALQTIRAEVAASLEGVGMPGQLYITLSAAPLTPESIAGKASITQKDGRVMYNFGGKSTVNATVGRLQGNFFLPKDGFTVDGATLKAYQAAKQAQESAKSITRK